MIKSEYFSHPKCFCSNQTDANSFIFNSSLGIPLLTVMRFRRRVCSFWQNKPVRVLSLVCRALFNNSLLEFGVSWNGLKSKNISGRSSYTRHLNYYVSKEMTGSVREADMSPCSYVLFILELEAIINYLGLTLAWAQSLGYEPAATSWSCLVNPFRFPPFALRYSDQI